MPVTLAPADTVPTYGNSEIGYVTAVIGEHLIISRAQEGTIAKSVVAGWVVVGSLTAKSLTDIEGVLELKAGVQSGTPVDSTHTDWARRRLRRATVVVLAAVVAPLGGLSIAAAAGVVPPRVAECFP